jgi:hypothetical protein
MISTMIPEKNPDLMWRSLDDGTVIINPEQGDVKVLNNVGARVWELVDGQRSVSQIAQEITQDYEISLDEANKDLQDYLKVMIGQGLLQWHGQDG